MAKLTTQDFIDAIKELSAPADIPGSRDVQDIRRYGQRSNL